MKYTLSMVMLSLGFMVGCSPANSENSNQPTDSSVELTEKKNSTNDSQDKSQLPTYKVAMVDTYPPFATTDGYGNLIGIDVDIIKAIGKEQGFTPKFVTHPWKGWQKDLSSGQVDIWASGVTIKEKRKEVASYSNPYMTYSTAVLTRADQESTNISENTLQEYKIGAEDNSTSLEIAKTLNPDPSQVVGFISNFLAFSSLQRKEVDAIVGNNIVLANIANSFPEYKFNMQLLSDEVTPTKQLGFMVKKDRKDLVKELNEGLADIKENGELEKIQQKWLGDLTAPEISNAIGS